MCVPRQERGGKPVLTDELQGVGHEGLQIDGRTIDPCLT
jgi:hypothetical protein